MTNKKRQSEEEFFALEDAEKKKRLSKEQEEMALQAEKERRRHEHYMKCPHCGEDLETTRIGHVDVDECKECGTLAVTKEELKKLIAEEKTFIKGFIDLFKKDES